MKQNKKLERQIRAAERNLIRAQNSLQFTLKEYVRLLPYERYDHYSGLRGYKQTIRQLKSQLKSRQIYLDQLKSQRN